MLSEFAAFNNLNQNRVGAELKQTDRILQQENVSHAFCFEFISIARRPDEFMTSKKEILLY